MEPKELHAKLVNALTQYDIKESKKKYYNRYALGQYFMAVENVEADIAGGMSARKAILNNFNGRLADVCLKAVGESVATKEECQSACW